MKITMNSVLVDDQDKALAFYTEVLGFVKKFDFPIGELRWLTLVSPDEPEGAQLLLEPNDNPVARSYQKSLFEQGKPLTAFAVENVQQEYERMKALGVVFASEPIKTPGATLVALDDTCGNFIQIYEVSVAAS